MNPIARDLARLREATREVDLDEAEARQLEKAASSWGLEMVAAWCSILEKTWRAGYLARDAEAKEESDLVHKRPEDWGWSAT